MKNDQQTIKSFDKLYRKSLQDNVINESEYESQCKNFTKKFGRNKKWIFFININIKIKFNFFGNNNLKFQLRT